MKRYSGVQIDTICRHIRFVVIEGQMKSYDEIELKLKVNYTTSFGFI
jgi:hypothetical protein